MICVFKDGVAIATHKDDILPSALTYPAECTIYRVSGHPEVDLIREGKPIEVKEADLWDGHEDIERWDGSRWVPKIPQPDGSAFRQAMISSEEFVDWQVAIRESGNLKAEVYIQDIRESSTSEQWDLVQVRYDQLMALAEEGGFAPPDETKALWQSMADQYRIGLTLTSRNSTS